MIKDKLGDKVMRKVKELQRKMYSYLADNNEVEKRTKYV